MTWEDKLDSDVDGFFEEAQEVIYHPATLVDSTAHPQTILAIVSESGDLGIQDDNPVYDKMFIVVKTADIPNPSYRDTFTIHDSSGEDRTWWVVSYQGGGDYNRTWTFEISNSTGHD